MAEIKIHLSSGQHPKIVGERERSQASIFEFYQTRQFDLMGSMIIDDRFFEEWFIDEIQPKLAYLDREQNPK